MLHRAAIYFVIAVIAGFFGFTGVAPGARTIAKLLCFVALAIVLVMLVFGVMLGMIALSRGGSPRRAYGRCRAAGADVHVRAARAAAPATVLEDGC